MAEFSHACSAFGFDLYGRLRKEKGNLVISPASISLAFAMTWAGARGQTAAEMAKALRFAGTVEEVTQSSAKVLASLTDPARSVTLRVANRLFVQQGYPLLDDFLQLTRNRFLAPAQPVDFLAEDSARKTINDWVARNTEQKILDLLPPGSVPDATKLVLANAVYFLGHWQKPFDTERTLPREFFVPGAATKTVRMMEQTETFRYAHRAGVQVLELPYVGGDVSMLLALPDARNGLAALEKGLSTERVDKWVGALEAEELLVVLPSFEMRYGTALKKPLTDLGMNLAFGESADFGGMSKRLLFIEDAYHQAFIKLDEKGTEAAAATAVVMRPSLAAPPPRLSFVADHPFLFLIRDVASGTVLFIGRVVEPPASDLTAREHP